MSSAALFTGSVGSSKLQLDWQGQSSTLELAGKGLRAKKVAFVSVSVYDAHLYVSSLESFDRSPAKALDSLSAQNQVAMVLKFHRGVTSKQVMDSFKEALTANQVSLDAPGIKEFLAAVEAGGSVEKGQTLGVVGLREAGGETLVFESAKGSTATIKGSAGLIRQVLSIWFGKMTESTMETLKSNLLKAP